MNTRKIGDLGESIACEFLRRSSFRIIERNYQKKWGELDVIGMKDGELHFFEVKSVSGLYSEGHRPEDNVHGLKMRHIGRMIQTYLAEKGKVDSEFSFSVLCVYLDDSKRKARVKWIKNVILC